MENNNQLNGLVETSISKIREMIDSSTVVGEPIHTPDGVTLIPVSRVSFGFGTGGGDGKNQNTMGGAGAGVRVEPIGFVVVKEGNVRMMNIQPPAFTTTDRIIQMVPDVLDKIENFIDKQKAGK